MKRINLWSCVLALMLLTGSRSSAVVVSTIEQLDALAEENGGFSFSVMGDNNGYAARNYDELGDSLALGMSHLEPWVKNNDKFCLAVGDHAIGTRKYWYQMNETDPFWHNHYYPSLGDNCNGTDYFYGVTGDQAVWGRGWVMFKALNNFFTRSNAVDQIVFRQPDTNSPVYSSVSKASPDTLVPYPDQLCDYYAKRAQGSFTIHIISVNFPDPGVLAERSKNFMMNKLYELSATKTDHDIIIVLAQKNNWLQRAQEKGWMSRAERDSLMAIADMTVCGDDHIYRRQNNYDADYDRTEALWMNSGQPCSTTGSGRGYLNCHVFDNPPRFTVQYILTDPATRALHVNAVQVGTLQKSLPAECTKPYLKYINGSYVSVNWNNFEINDLSTNSAQFVSQDVPDALAPGEHTTVSVTLKNSGMEPWSTAAGHRLGSQNPSNNTFWGLSRVDLPSTVETNQQCIFTFDITAPTNSGTYNFQWRMIDESGENQGWFGVPTPTVPMVVAWPASNLVKNASFEAGAATPDFWTVPANYSRSSQDADDGLFALKGTGSGGIGSVSQTVALKTNTLYNIKVKIKFLAGGTGPVVFDTSDKFDGAGQGQFILNSPNSDWQLFEGSFNSGTNTFVTLRVFTETAFSGTFYVDDVELNDPSVVIHNYAPKFTSTPSTLAESGTLYTYAAQASDADGNPFTFSAPIKPEWLSLDTGTGLLSGTPSTNDFGSHPAALRVSDGTFSSYQTFTVMVSRSGNDAPVITTLPATGVLENNAYSYTLSAEDYDGDPLTYGVAVKPSWLGFNAGNRVLSGTPTSAHIGLHPVSLTVSDGTVTVTQQFNIAVFATPAPANLVLNGSFEQGGTNPASWTRGLTASGSGTTAQDGTNSLRITTATNTGATTQTITIQTGTTYNISVWINAAGITSAGVVFDTGDKYDNPGQGQFVVTTNSGWTQYTGSFTATNTSVTLRIFPQRTNYVGTAYFDNIVLAPANASNRAPVITSVAITNATQNTAYSYTLLAADVENNPLTFTGISVPAWLSFNTNSGVLGGIPGIGDVGSHPVALRVSDSSMSVTQNFTIAVAEVVLSGYDAWAASNAVGSANEDDDNDGRSNFYEYILGGSPTNGVDTGTEPVFTMSTNGFEYTHFQRSDDPTLTYAVEVSTNLISGVWTNAAFTAETNGTGGAYDEVTHHVPMDKPKSYIRLKITNQ